MASGADRRLYWTAGITVLVLDIITKYWAESELMRHSGRSVFGDWFQLRLVYNPGAAFGLDLGPFSRWIFMGVAVVAVVALYRMSVHAETGDWFRQLALGLVSGGALGNLIDRVRSSQGVVDFLDLGVNAWRWPTFNVADMAVSCGAIALAVSLWKEDARREAAAAGTGAALPPEKTPTEPVL
ncbi:MAG TPA: signal peptidase II [Gemmatimonadales bacterium]|nr:signal peptidase II [Gemmatimonadales bacterium]